MLKCIEVQAKQVACVKCKNQGTVSVITLTTYESETCSEWIAPLKGWAVHFFAEGYEFLCDTCVTGAFFQTKDATVEQFVRDIAKAEIDLLKGIDDKLSKLATFLDPANRKQQGVDRDGNAWCHMCPDGECTGVAILDACEIRKGRPLPEGIPFVNLKVPATGKDT